jgi:hypothetical protein
VRPNAWPGPRTTPIAADLSEVGGRGQDSIDERNLPLGLEREPLRDVAYIAELLDIPLKSVHDFARRGILPSIKLDRHRRFVVADVEHALDTLRRAG